MRRVFVLLMLMLLYCPAMAAEDTASPGAREAVGAEAQLQKQAAALMKNMSDSQKEAFAQISTNFGMLRAVTIVRKDVSKAVVKCGEANPDLKQKMKDRFAAWEKKVVPLVKSNETKMKDAIGGGLFKDPVKVKSYLDKVDALAVKADSKIDKQIMTDKDSCEDLLESMDDTEGTVADVLEDIEWPESPTKAGKE